MASEGEREQLWKVKRGLVREGGAVVVYCDLARPGEAWGGLGRPGEAWGGLGRPSCRRQPGAAAPPTPAPTLLWSSAQVPAKREQFGELETTLAAKASLDSYPSKATCPHLLGALPISVNLCLLLPQHVPSI